MKIVASLLRPMVKVSGDGDFCLRPELSAAVRVPPVEVRVSEVPFGATGTVTVPDAGVSVSAIPVDLTIGQVILGQQVGVSVTGTIGGFSAGIHLPSPIAVGLHGSLGGLHAAMHVREPVTATAEGCIQGVARLNPHHLQVPTCCEGFKRRGHCDDDCERCR